MRVVKVCWHNVPCGMMVEVVISVTSLLPHFIMYGISRAHWRARAGRGSAR